MSKPLKEEAKAMFESENKSTPAKKAMRLEHIIQNRLRDEFSLSAEQIANFGDWMDEQLAGLEVIYGLFVTKVSRRGSIGR
jgi:hypothetical protein